MRNPVKFAQGLRRLWEAAQKDGTPDRFYDDFSASLRAGEITNNDISIRSLFESLVEDGAELVRAMDPRHQGDGVNFSKLLEADTVNTAAFSNITGQIVYSKVMEAYNDELFAFTQLIPTVSTPFNGEKIGGIGRVGDKSEQINEGEEYPTVGVNEDWIETPATTKKGLIVPVTKEIIFFDRTGLLLRRCGEVGNALGIQREKKAIDCVIDENRTAHRYKWKGTTYATYQSSSPWDNVTASNALVDWTDIDAAEQTLASIVDPNTGEPILMMPKHLIVTRQLLYTARRVVNATEITVTTPGYATSANPTETKTTNPIGNYQIISSQLLASRLATDTDWFLGDVSKAFAYMENWPMTVVQAPANSEQEFTRDIVMRFKASERGEFATMDPRYIGKCTA